MYTSMYVRKDGKLLKFNRSRSTTVLFDGNDLVTVKNIWGAGTGDFIGQRNETDSPVDMAGPITAFSSSVATSSLGK